MLTACGVLIFSGFFLRRKAVSGVEVGMEAPLHVSAKNPPASIAQEDIGMPTRLSIPVVGVDAAIEKVTVTGDGSMDVPKDPGAVAWYMLGSKPGEKGSAVLAGHVNWLHGANAVFKRLDALRPGDVISVQDDRGKIMAFTVRERRTYAATADATEVFLSNDGKARLNLITCFGTWDTRARQYSQRLVVFAERATGKITVR